MLPPHGSFSQVWDADHVQPRSHDPGREPASSSHTWGFARADRADPTLTSAFPTHVGVVPSSSTTSPPVIVPAPAGVSPRFGIPNTCRPVFLTHVGVVPGGRFRHGRGCGRPHVRGRHSSLDSPLRAYDSAYSPRTRRGYRSASTARPVRGQVSKARPWLPVGTRRDGPGQSVVPSAAAYSHRQVRGGGRLTTTGLSAGLPTPRPACLPSPSPSRLSRPASASPSTRRTPRSSGRRSTAVAVALPLVLGERGHVETELHRNRVRSICAHASVAWLTCIHLPAAATPTSGRWSHTRRSANLVSENSHDHCSMHVHDDLPE